MLQYILAGKMPTARLLRSRCLADPDALLEIAQQVGQTGLAAQEAADRFSLILHDLRMGGAWKRTARGRLERTEEMLCAHIHPTLQRGLTFLDIGASDGITTVDGVRALRKAFGGGVKALLTDLNLWLLRYRRGPIAEYRATDGEPIMARLGPVGVRLARNRHDAAPDHNLLAQLYLRLSRFRSSMRLDGRISLIHPIARSEPGITIVELDCLVRSTCLEDRIGAIRASNVLNLGYFNHQQLRRATGHLHAYLREGGCLVVSRNQDQPAGEPENGSVWLKERHRFRWQQDFGTGSEIKSVVDCWSLD
ncbi:MAG: hypothetical protein ACLPWG_22890 [Steroidobacteraceae bacterium]